MQLTRWQTVTVCGVATLAGVSIRLPGRQAVKTEHHPAFTAVSHTTYSKGNGQVTATQVDTDSMLPDGSMIHIRNSYNNKPMGWKTMIDLKSKRSVVIDPETKSKTTYPLSSRESAHYQNLAACEGDSAVTLLGYKVVKKVSEHPGPNNTEASVEEWDAPALGCFALSRSHLLKSGNQVLGRQDTVVTSVILGEAASSELIIPAEYTERTPSEVMKESDRISGRSCPKCEVHTQSKLDEVYQSHQR